MTEEPPRIPFEPREPPQPGSYDWIVGGTKAHEVDLPIEGDDGKIRVLRVEILAKARVSPNRPWGYIVLVWGLAVLALLAVLVLKPAHGAEPWRSYMVGPNTYTDGPDSRARAWRDGPNTYTETTRRDGTKTRCRSWIVGPNNYMTCD